MHDLNVYSSGERPTFDREDRNFVYAVARRIVGSAEAAEDVAQDAMLLAFRHRDSFRGDSRYRTWLYRIASTTALGYLRRGRRSREQLARADEPNRPEAADPARSPEMLVADHECAAAAREAIAKLAPKYRDVLLLRTELSEPQIAARLGITVANVKIRAHRARHQLRAVLAREPANDHVVSSSPGSLR